MIALTFGLLIACSAVYGFPRPGPGPQPYPQPAAMPQPMPQPMPAPAAAPQPHYGGYYGGVGFGVEELVIEAPYGPYEQFIGGPVYPEVIEEVVFPGYGYGGYGFGGYGRGGYY